MPGRRRQVAIVATGLAIALAVVTIRLLVDARSAYRSGVVADQHGDTPEAIRHYLTAARLYVPGSPYTHQAIERLEAIATANITKGEYGTARTALEAERAALLSTRSFYTPYAARLPDIERRLSRLLAANEERGALGTFEERAKWHADRLAERTQPKTSLVLLALLGLGVWVSSAIVFFRKGLESGLLLRRLPAAIAGVGFILGLGLFLVCLRLA
jgi:hypothetical protein